MAHQPLLVINAKSIFYIYTVIFETIQFCKSTQFNSIRPIDRTLSGATTPGQNGPWSDGNEGVLCIPQSSSITIKLFSIISRTLIREALLLCSEAVGVFYSPSFTGKFENRELCSLFVHIYIFV